jgi:hypothetical protein
MLLSKEIYNIFFNILIIRSSKNKAKSLIKSLKFLTNPMINFQSDNPVQNAINY